MNFYLFVYGGGSVHVCVCRCVHACGGQRTTLGISFHFLPVGVMLSFMLATAYARLAGLQASVESLVSVLHHIV